MTDPRNEGLSMEFPNFTQEDFDEALRQVEKQILESPIDIDSLLGELEAE